MKNHYLFSLVLFLILLLFQCPLQAQSADTDSLEVSETKLLNELW